jgi:DNA mismatch repair protein MutL
VARIRLLDEALINQIAAGEVVERPASVLKELGENALDAGARALQIQARGGGVELLSVSDDGSGMPRDDAERCVLRHATSKLRDAEGLLAIRTLGFRGEALAAIAAVSRLGLTTAEEGTRVGTHIVSVGGRTEPAADAPPIRGTTGLVEDLFFNVPARRKFLRREETESRHIEEAVLRLALGHPAVAFRLDLDGKRRLTLAAGEDLRERLAHAVGHEAHRHLLSVEERRLGLRVWGYLASPELTLSNARGLYFFVNGRYVRDRGLLSALQRALGGALPPGRQPVAALYLEMEPGSVDVNVHPQKTEVRFNDTRGVYDAVHAAIVHALEKAPWRTPAPTSDPNGAHYADAVERFLQRATSHLGETSPFLTPFSAAERPLAFGQARPGVNEAAPPDYFGALRHLGTLARRFLTLEGPGGTLVVLDVHAALERIHAARLREDFVAGGPRERGLTQGAVQLPPGEEERLRSAAAWLERLGIEVEPFGSGSLVLRALPPPLVDLDPVALLVELASALPAGDEAPTLEGAAEAIALLACRAAEGAARRLGENEIRRLLEQLDRTPAWLGARHTRVVVLEMPQLELVRRAEGKLGPAYGAG